MGMPSAALPWFERVRALKPNHVELATNHVTALLALGACERAATVAKIALVLQPARSQYSMDLGKAQTAGGLEDQALKIIRWARLLEPTRADLRAWTAELCLSIQQPEKAQRWIIQAIEMDPKTAPFYALLGRSKQQTAELDGSLASFERSVLLSPLDLHSRYLVAELHRGAKKLRTAQGQFHATLLIAPASVKSMLGLARCQIPARDFDDALRWIERAQSISPSAPSIRALKANTLIDAGLHTEALAVLHHSMLLFPDIQETYLRLSVLDILREHLGNALKHLDRLEVLAPSLPAASLCRGDALTSARRFNEAIRAYEIAIERRFCLLEAYTGKGSAEFKIGRLEAALISFENAVAVSPDAPEPRLQRGNTLMALNRFDAALKDFDAVLDADLATVPLYIHRGNTLFALGRLDEALQSYEDGLRIEPSSVEAYIGIAAVHQKCRRYRDALNAHEGAFRLSHRDPLHLGSLIYCSMKSWARDQLAAYLHEGLLRIHEGKDIGNPFPLLTAIDDPFILRQVAVCHGKSLSKLNAPPPSDLRATPKDTRVTIAYFSSDLDRQHPVGVNLQPLLKAHDRQRFKLLAFNLSENNNADLLPLFDEVHQAFCLSDSEIAVLARERSVDIAIDLNGYTEGARTSIFGFRPAPIQINFLGYPGTMGTSFHDFIVADEQVIPDSALPAYTEQVLRLPHFFMPYDFRSSEENQAPRPTRASFGLPADAFVYCSFNDFHKITQTMLSSWIHILRESENSVLWLALRGDVSETALRKIFESEGIAWSRVIVAHRVESAGQHHARLSLADLMLDTFPYNSHTTACDAIKSGLPVLTLCGNSFQSRVCSSLLLFLGSHSLIAQDRVEFTEKAVALARDKKKFAKVKEAYLRGRTKLVQPDAYARSLEKLFSSILSSN
jgi:predicted O-linked N-acetylglucosamine transferase (SPINDLY family)